MPSQMPTIEDLTNKLGYHFVLDEASYPDALGNGTSGTVTLKLNNTGVAPIFVEAHVKLALLDSNNNVLATDTLENMNPFSWKPGVISTSSHSFSFPSKPNGTKLAVGLFTCPSLSNPNIKLGNTGRIGSGWYVLGTS